MRFVEYVHPTARFGLPLPRAWEQIELRDLEHGPALIAVAPGEAEAFRPNLVVVVEPLPESAGLGAWSLAATQLLPQRLEYYQLLDFESTVIAGDRPAVRILSHHAVSARFAVVLEQWLVKEGRFGYTLSASVGTPEYLGLAEVFAITARGFLPGPGQGR